MKIKCKKCNHIFLADEFGLNVLICPKCKSIDLAILEDDNNEPIDDKNEEEKTIQQNSGIINDILNKLLNKNDNVNNGEKNIDDVLSSIEGVIDRGDTIKFTDIVDKEKEFMNMLFPTNKANSYDIYERQQIDSYLFSMIEFIERINFYMLSIDIKLTKKEVDELIIGEMAGIFEILLRLCVMLEIKDKDFINSFVQRLKLHIIDIKKTK